MMDEDEKIRGRGCKIPDPDCPPDRGDPGETTLAINAFQRDLALVRAAKQHIQLADVAAYVQMVIVAGLEAELPPPEKRTPVQALLGIIQSGSNRSRIRAMEALARLATAGAPATSIQNNTQINIGLADEARQTIADALRKAMRSQAAGAENPPTDSVSDLAEPKKPQ